MSERSFKWRSSLQSAFHSNRMIKSKPIFPNKFSPARQNSMEVSKMFNISQSRLHASMEAMGKSRMESSIDKSRNRPVPLPKTPIQDKKIINQNKLMASTSPMKLMTQTKGVTADKQNHTHKGSGVSPHKLNEIKKEYLAFKQNVLRELDRQREMVEKFVKEIVLTVQFELEKLRNESKSCDKVGNGTAAFLPLSHTNLAPRTLQEWKSKLSKVSIAIPAPGQPQSAPSPPKDPFMGIVSSKPVELLPPQAPLDMSVFLSTFDRLKRQMSEMDRLLTEPGGRTVQAEKSK